MRIQTYGLLFLAVTVFSGVVSPRTDAQEREIKFKTDPEQRIDARFRLFQTNNIWTFLLLDTSTGRVWQVVYGVEGGSTPGTLVLNDIPLVAPDQELKAARFTLYKTTNMYNYILLDQDDGRVWQCQWSLETKLRGLIPMQSLIQVAPPATAQKPSPQSIPSFKSHPKSP